ncbi:hypothetical protein PsYK624_048130 [Phanerochaete sordida]|uniref:F-box domain-containing protein n=1 Tax=Phanerochaete sordida TaxID=48140 RepID=A0A9P3G6I3_9APHY|nr:hypothetical protein PsYK624_048130 [Phanerochaete sordida]
MGSSDADTSDTSSEACYLPPELVFNIVQLFEATARRDEAYLSDHSTRHGLSACASACREWCTRFQPLLFQRLRISTLADVETLAALVRIHPALGQWVDTLVLVEDQDPHAHMLILLLTSRLPSLTSLTIQVVGEARQRVAPFQYPPILASISGFQGVKNLTLERCRFSSFKSLSRVVSAFPKLISLACRGVTWDVSPLTSPDGLVIPTGIYTASDTLANIEIEDCSQYGLFLLLLCATSSWSSKSKRGLFTRIEGPVVGRLVHIFAASGVNSMVCYRRLYTDSGYLDVSLADRVLFMQYEFPREKPCTNSVDRILLSVNTYEPATQPHPTFMNPKEITSLLRQFQGLNRVEYRNEYIHLRPRDMSLFHNLSAALPGAHVVFQGLDDVTDRPYHLDNRRKVQPEFHCAVDVQPFGVAGLVVPQRVCDGYFRTSRRTVNSSIVFPGGIRLHHALDGRYDHSPGYASHPAAVEDHYELGMKSALRLLWPGYPPWFYLFYAHDPDQPVVRSPSRLGTIARRVAWAIIKFVEVRMNIGLSLLHNANDPTSVQGNEESPD